MIKPYQLFAILPILFILISCENYDEYRKNLTGGDVDEIMFIIDDRHLEAALSDSLIYHFAVPFPGLPQYHEALFPIKIRSFNRYAAAPDIFHKYRNLAFVSVFTEESKINRLIQGSLGRERVQQAIDDGKLFYYIEKNKFAKPQLVIYLFAPTLDLFYSRLNKHKQALFDEIKEAETHLLHKKVYGQGRNVKAINVIKGKFGIQVDIPSKFMTYKEDSNLVWVAQEYEFRDKLENITKQVKLNILIRSFPIAEESGFLDLQDTMIEKHGVLPYPFIFRDSITSTHVYGSDSSYTMYIDKIRPLYQRALNINEVVVLENRGLWRLDMPYMGGPFYTFAFMDQDNKNLIIMDSYIYAAGSDKRKMLREMETIFSTLQYATPN